MKLVLTLVLAPVGIAVAEIPEVPDSLSPDGKIHVVMDIDRDPEISPRMEGRQLSAD